MDQISLKELPRDGKFWRVDWIGNVAYNPNVDSESRVHILVSELKPGYEDSLDNLSLTTSRWDLWIGAGQLPLVSQGSVWHNGELYSAPGNDRSSAKLETFKIEPNKRLSSTFSGKIAVNGHNVPLIPRSEYEVGKNFKHLARSPVWLYPVSGKSFSYVLISPAELLRSYYLSSNKVVPAIFGNDIGHLIDLESSRLLENGDVLLSLLKTTDGDDSWFIARWYADVSTQREIAELHRQLMTSSANAPLGSDWNTRAFPITINFPFDSATTLSAYGKRIKLADARPNSDGKETCAFLVLSIRSCSHPLPYSNLAIQRKNDSRKGANSEDLELPEMSYSSSASLSDQKLPNDGLNLAKDEEPSRRTRALLAQLFKNRFIDLQGRELHQDDKALQKFRAAKGRARSAEEFAQHGTGAGTSGASNTGPINLRQLGAQLKAKLPTDLATFCQALKHVREETKDKQWDVQTIMLSERCWPMDSEDVATFLPLFIRGCRSWHLMSTKPPRPRALIIGRISTMGGVTYLLELERKQEKRSVLIMRSDERTSISNTVLERFLEATARRNRWPSDHHFPRLIRQTLRHNEHDSIDEFATRILKKVEALST
ncbi:hypothetical protein ACTSKR_01400 [Chitinibacteraceae bacterium HSL-7]